jgi:pectate lyase
MTFRALPLTKLVSLFVFIASLALAGEALPASPGQGFGGATSGGDHAREIIVTRLDDALDAAGQPARGTFRWAVTRKFPRKVVFAVAGDIILSSRLEISGSERKNLTVDGSTAPGKGVCIRGGEIAIRNTEQVIFRHVRIRRGRDGVGPFPATGPQGSSANLDCVELRKVKDILFDHVSFSWSCDELIGITNSRNVTFQWCIFSEPLGDELYAIHPYGNQHSACLNISSSTVSIHHSLLSTFRSRGPQFEANDVRSETLESERLVQLESVNNVIHNYLGVASRYHTEIESNTPVDANFFFQFINNRYLHQTKARSEIWANDSGNANPRIKVYLHGNLGPNRPTQDLPQHALVFTRNKAGRRVPLAAAETNYLQQLSERPLITHAPAQQITLHEPNDEFVALVLKNVGARPDARDATDLRIVSSVPLDDRAGTFRAMVRSPAEVGGWPDLTGTSPEI